MCIRDSPIDIWEQNGAPVMTAQSWANPCMNIAEKDLDNLQHVFNTTVRLGGKESLRAISEDE
eukprot:626674-Lingulodinium_polyedra.AAC.1